MSPRTIFRTAADFAVMLAVYAHGVTAVAVGWIQRKFGGPNAT